MTIQISKLVNKLRFIVLTGIMLSIVSVAIAQRTIHTPAKADTGRTLLNYLHSYLIPIDSTRWYQEDNTSNGLGGLFDGVLTQNVNTGYGKLIDNFDAYYPVIPGESISIDSIKMYSYQGGLGTDTMKVFTIDTLGVRTQIASFVGYQYQTWVGPILGVNSFALKVPATNIKYIVINSYGGYPTEMQFYGKYTAPPAAQPLTQPAYPLNQYLGVNGFEWNFEDPNNPLVVSPTYLKGMQSFTQVRHYLDWNKLESNQGEYTFNPVHSGGWNYDAMYQSCLANNIVVLGDIKTQPGWMTATYPVNLQDSENVPVLYGKDFTDPNSYLEQAKVAFQYAARYGSNASVSTALLSVDDSTRWTDDPANQVKKDMKLIHYVECDNERDKWWKGRIAYQTNYEYAANMSAFYDGNKNTMGPGVGVKNADPNMMVVMGGLSSADPSYVHGMIEWCRQHRGYKADGTVNLCWDIINYHYYSNNGVSGGVATTGIAPEVSGAGTTALAFINMSHQYAVDMPVWVTEAGYDVNSGSPQRAPAIGSKTALQVQADWILRTSLLYARSGIARVFFYEAYDDNLPNPTQYASSGLLNPDQTRKPSADYLMQLNKLFGNYTYQSTLNSSPIVDLYAVDSLKMYAITMPTQTGATAKYTLTIPGDTAYVYTPAAGANNMTVKMVKAPGGKLSITATETPVFVVAGAKVKPIVPVKPPSVNPLSTINLYPNPFSRYITVAFSDSTMGPVTIKITGINTALVYDTFTFQKSTINFSNILDLLNVPLGVSVVEVIQGGNTISRKILKTTQR